MAKRPLIVEEPLGEILLAETIAQGKAKQQLVRQNFDRSLGDTWEEYQQELAKIRGSLKRFAEYVFGFTLEPHHLFFVKVIEDLIANKLPTRKVAFIAPPNSAKSTYVSIIHPLWYLGNHPTHQLIFLTSADPMAVAFGNTIKGVFESHEKYHEVFPANELRPDPKRGWSGDGLYLRGANPLEKDPSYRAMGMRASITGGRAHGIIIDDPLSYKDSQSDTEQDAVKDNHDTTIKTRLHLPSEGSDFEGWEICVGTRWKENDWLQHLEDRGDVQVINLPVRAQRYDIANPNSKPDPLGREEGERLWPKRYTTEFLTTEERAMGTAMFNCVYGGDPTSMGGDIFQSESWFRPLPSDFYVKREDGHSMYDLLPRIQAYDTAFSERDTACYTVGGTFSINPKTFEMYLIDVVRERMSTKTFEDMVVEKAREYSPRYVAIEEAAFRHTVVRKSVRAIRRRCRYNVYSVAQSSDKVARARLAASVAQHMDFYLDDFAPWAPSFKRECLGFPNAQYKDQVDMFSLASEMVEKFRVQKTAVVKKMRIQAHSSRRQFPRQVA